MLFTEFKDEMLTLLGGNLVDVELDDKDYQMALKRAIRTFQQKGNNSYRRTFQPLVVTKNEYTYQLPAETLTDGKIDTIVKIVKPSAGWNVEDPFSIAAYNDMFYGVGEGGGCGCNSTANYLNYELTLQTIENARRYMAYETQFVHDKFKNTIRLLKKPEKDTTWLLDCYVNLTQEEYMDVLWVQSWALTELKIILGTAYRKFQSLAAPTGETTLSGSEYIQEARDAQEQLIEDILNGVDGDVSFSEIRFG